MTTTTPVPLPPRMARLPIDRHGRVVPFFVAWPDGVPDHRIVDPDKQRDCDRFDLCWLCGQRRGRYGTFAVGPMCTVNRTSAEPPSHADCAAYAVLVCPFMLTPRMARRERQLPDGVVDPAGTMLRRNPGVTALWTSRNWQKQRVHNGDLYDIGDPSSVTWWAEGRLATRDEVQASVDSGLPSLQEQCDNQRDRLQLSMMVAAAARYVPRL